MKILLVIFTILYISIESRLLPPKITKIGCDVDNIIITTSFESCNRIIRGTSEPGTTISIYSTNYLERAGPNFKYLDLYINTGSVQKSIIEYNGNDMTVEIIDGTIIFSQPLYNYNQNFVNYDIIEMYVINYRNCLIAVKQNNEYDTFGYCQFNSNLDDKKNIKEIATSMTGYIVLDFEGKIYIHDYSNIVYDTQIKYKKIYAGGIAQYCALTTTNKLIILRGGGNINLVFEDEEPKFIVFTNLGGGFIDKNRKLQRWGDNKVNVNDFPQIVADNIIVDSNGNWIYELTDDNLFLFINHDDKHLIIQSSKNNKYSGIVSYNNTLLFVNNISYSIPSIQIDILASDGYISGVGIPNSEISLYSIGQKNFDFIGPVQYGCNIYACAEIINGIVNVTGNSNYGGEISSVKSFTDHDVVELYVIYYGAFVAIKQDGKMISWGSYSYGGGKYFTDVIQVATCKTGFIILLNDGSININGNTKKLNTPYNFIQVYAGGTNVYAGLNLLNQLFIWINNTEEIYQINNKNGRVILTDWTCGIIYNNEELVSFSTTNNYIDERDIYHFITNNIYTDDNGNFKYKLTEEQIDKITKLHSHYITLYSKYYYMYTSLVYSEKISFTNTLELTNISRISSML